MARAEIGRPSSGTQYSVLGTRYSVLKRRGVVAMEFAIVASLLFTLLLGMIEFGRAMMVLNVVSNAARTGARAGALSSGSYSSATAAAGAVLTAAGITGTPTYTVAANGVAVANDATFQAAAIAGSAVSVKVSVKYTDVSWLPAGCTIFLSSTQSLSEAAVMRKEN